MSNIELVNYKYLGIAVIFLMFAIYYLHKTKKHIHKREMDTSYSSAIKVLTQKGEIYMDPNIFEMHMSRLKNNIIKLHQNFDKSNCSQLKQYLNKAKINTKQYIDLNTKNLNPAFCDISNQNNIFNDYILQERELLKNKMANKTEGDDNDDDYESDKLRYQLLELITDIDLILFLIKLSLCKNGSLDLSCLDQIILELYRTQCSVDTNLSNSDKTESFSTDSCVVDVCGLNTPTKCYGEKKLYRNPLVNQYLDVRPEGLSKCVPSDEFLDTDTMPYKESFTPLFISRSHKQENLIEQSQPKEKAFDCNEVRLGKQLEISDYAKDRLYFYRNYRLENRSGQILEDCCRSGLLSDYNDDNLRDSISTKEE